MTTVLRNRRSCCVAAIVIGDGAGLEIVQPMAVVMLGGLVTSAVVEPVRVARAVPAVRAARRLPRAAARTREAEPDRRCRNAGAEQTATPAAGRCRDLGRRRATTVGCRRGRLSNGPSNGMRCRMDRPRASPTLGRRVDPRDHVGWGRARIRRPRRRPTSGAATVEAVEGTDISRVTLTEDAARRLDVQTAAVACRRGRNADPVRRRPLRPRGRHLGVREPRGH